MKTKIIITGLAALLVAGCCCYTRSTQINKVQLGMDETKVVTILGNPIGRGESREDTNTTVTLYYWLQEVPSFPPVPYSVRLVNGKVEAFGRDSGVIQSRTRVPR
jgi:hypothetical protein